eukprot:g134.t1
MEARSEDAAFDQLNKDSDEDGDDALSSTSGQGNHWMFNPKFSEYTIAKVHKMQMLPPGNNGERRNGFQKCDWMVVLVDQIYNTTGTVELRVRDETGYAMATVQDQAAEAHAGEILVGSVMVLKNVTAWRNTLPRPEENALFEGLNMSDPDIDYSQFFLNICLSNIDGIVSPHQAVPKIFKEYRARNNGGVLSQTSSVGSTPREGSPDGSVVGLTKAQREEAARREFADLAPEDLESDEDMPAQGMSVAESVPSSSTGSSNPSPKNTGTEIGYSGGPNNSTPAVPSGIVAANNAFDELLGNDDY